MQSSGRFLLSILPAGGTGGALHMSAVDVQRAFVLAYEAQYGLHPQWVSGSLPEALAVAKRECRLLLVYLHSFEHGDTEAFAKTLASEAVIEFVDRNMVMWAVDGASQAGFEVAASLGAMSYPYVAVLHLSGESDRGQEVRVLGSFVGPQGVDELLSQLMSLLEEHDAVLLTDRLEREERERSRTLLQQQDREYEEALKADKRQQDQKQKQEQVVPVATAHAAPAPAARAVVAAPVAAAAAAAAVRYVLLPEPEAGTAGMVRIALRLPSERLERRFRGEEPVAAVFAFVDEKIKEKKDYKLVSAYPRMVLRRTDEKTMSQVGSTTLLYEEEEEE